MERMLTPWNARDKEKRDNWREGTRIAKRALISPEPLSGARARVTFSFPPWAREEVARILRSDGD